MVSNKKVCQTWVRSFSYYQIPRILGRPWILNVSFLTSLKKSNNLLFKFPKSISLPLSACFASWIPYVSHCCHLHSGLSHWKPKSGMRHLLHISQIHNGQVLVILSPKSSLQMSGSSISVHICQEQTWLFKWIIVKVSYRSPATRHPLHSPSILDRN